MLSTASALLGLVLLGGSPALPCASLVHEVGALAESNAQEAILWRDGQGSVIEYQIRYEGDAADFGWIIAIPEGFLSLEEGDSERFDTLRSWSQPTVRWPGSPDDDESSGCGCGGAKSGALEDRALSDSGGDFGNDVDIVAEGFAGDYAYTVVASDDAEDLAAWLEENDWSAGSTQQTLDAYVAAGGFEFVLVELRPAAAQTPEGGRLLPPVVIRTTSNELRYPSSMARHAGPTEFRTTLYVLGDVRARVLGAWEQVDDTRIEGDSNPDPLARYEDWLWEIGGNSATFARVYSSSVEGIEGGSWLTRFDTRALAVVHEEDVLFAIDDGEVGQRLVIVYDSEPASGAGWLLPIGPLLGAGWLFRRRRQAGPTRR